MPPLLVSGSTGFRDGDFILGDVDALKQIPLLSEMIEAEENIDAIEQATHFPKTQTTVMRGGWSSMRAKVRQGPPLPNRSLPFGSVSRSVTSVLLGFDPMLPSEFMGRVKAVSKKTHLRHFGSN